MESLISGEESWTELLTIHGSLRGAVGVGGGRSCRTAVGVHTGGGRGGVHRGAGGGYGGRRLVLRGHGGLVGHHGDGQDGGQDGELGENHRAVWKYQERETDLPLTQSDLGDWGIWGNFGKFREMLHFLLLVSF